LSFLAPYWLLTASAILIPIAIHLWNKRQGKTVKVGSLRWLEASASNQWSSIKLNNFWLLALRCLIFILLAIALAQPVWEHQQKKPQGTKAVYVSEDLLYTSARNQISPTIDSLLKRGYTLHSFTPKLTAIPLLKWQQINRRTQDSLITNTPNYWSLVRSLTTKHKLQQDSIWLFTSDQQQYFTGTRPTTLPSNIYWLPIATNTSINWLQAAIQPTPDSLLLLFGRSSREETAYYKYAVKASTPSITLPNNQEVKLLRQQDTLIVNIASNYSKVKIQTQPLQIAIINDKTHQDEVRYLRAAIRAISSYTNLPIQITADTTKANWVFWLHAQKVPESIIQNVKQGTNLWMQHISRFTTTATSITGFNVQVKRISASQPQSENLVWTAANGETLLAFKTVGSGRVYTFSSGFAPKWSDLGQSAQLPELLLPLLFPQPQNIKYDFRAVDEKQLAPISKSSTPSKAHTKTASESLLKWIVLAAFGLFLIERIIANRRIKV
jgi:hypothetical protein